jgi:broad specificity phosphatase PhoE
MADGPRFDVFFIPAGPTAWDLAGRLVGRTDLPIAPEGAASVKAAAEALAKTLQTNHVTVLNGPDEASVSAGAIVARILRAKTRTLPGLAAMDLGLWEGMTRDELSERCPKVERAFACDPSTVVPPGGEGWAEARTRTVSAFMAGLPRRSGTVVVVARPGAWVPLRAGLDELIGREEERDHATWAPWGESERLEVNLAAAESGGWISMWGFM